MQKKTGERYSKEDTHRVAENLLSLLSPSKDNATVVGLIGDLGAGKTTLTQSIAKILGIQEDVQSPTFVIAKFYNTTHPLFQRLVHVDAYRIESLGELEPLGWENILSSPDTLLIVEWADRIQDALPKDTHYSTITHEGEFRSISHA